jgi:hypothetical protein
MSRATATATIGIGAKVAGQARCVAFQMTRVRPPPVPSTQWNVAKGTHSTRLTGDATPDWPELTTTALPTLERVVALWSRQRA